MKLFLINQPNHFTEFLELTLVRLENNFEKNVWAEAYVIDNFDIYCQTIYKK